MRTKVSVIQGCYESRIHAFISPTNIHRAPIRWQAVFRAQGNVFKKQNDTVPHARADRLLGEVDVKPAEAQA